MISYLGAFGLLVLGFIVGACYGWKKAEKKIDDILDKLSSRDEE